MVDVDKGGPDSWLATAEFPLDSVAGSTGAFPQLIQGERYRDLGLIGSGGMGEVRRVLDTVLDRTLAMKVVRRSEHALRFAQEARATARLEHPGVVPVHDMGVLPDGRVYMTMREVVGTPMGQVIAAVHQASQQAGAWIADPETSFTLRRLVGAVLRMAEAIAYAHTKGVLHRDIKPSNVMIGEHGEVLVVDWGLAYLGRESLEEGDDPGLTLFGEVMGTPAYMAPEVARGARADERTDVYGMGAVLYEVLCGSPPHEGEDAQDVLNKVRAGPTVALGERSTLPLPADLMHLTDAALHLDPSRRLESAGAFARGLQAWLEGARRRDEATQLMNRAIQNREQAEALVRRADEVEGQALPGAKEQQDRWVMEDQIDGYRNEAGLLQVRYEMDLHAALRVDEGHLAAHRALVELHLQRHKAAESARHDGEALREELVLKEHLAHLRADDPFMGQVGAYLRGDGALSLVTEPAGARVELFRFETEHRRLKPRHLRTLGTTPLTKVRLEPGSYLCELHHPNHHVVRYPVFISRQSHWDGVSPWGDSVVRLPVLRALAEDDRLIPAGWTLAGGDALAEETGPRMRRWCDAFVMKVYNVTNREYLVFLNDLALQGRVDDALRWAPRERSGPYEATSAQIYGFDGELFFMQPDKDGDLWHPDWPVAMVDFDSVQAYATWYAERTGLPWRLPMSGEWEKAARGVDGRFYPWGDRLDPSWCNMAKTLSPPFPEPVNQRPADVSVYGVVGLGGNIREWTLDLASVPWSEVVEVGFVEGQGVRVLRGGTWVSPAARCRSAHLTRAVPWVREPYVGFRLVRSV